MVPALRAASSRSVTWICQCSPFSMSQCARTVLSSGCGESSRESAKMRTSVDAPSPGAQPRQPLLGLRRAQLTRALVPLAGLVEVGLHALYAPARELAWIVGGRQ